MSTSVVEGHGSGIAPTTLTTFVGLAPMMLQTGLQTRFRFRMAISLAFGVAFSSFVPASRYRVCC